MAYTITSESYGRRLPKITATADSADDLATLGIDWAEGSSCVIGTKTYVLDKVSGWVESGSGGGGSSDYFDVLFTLTKDQETREEGVTCDQTFEGFVAAINAGKSLRAKLATRDWPSDGSILDLSTQVGFLEGNVENASFYTAPEVSVNGVGQYCVSWSDGGAQVFFAEYPTSTP